MQKFISFKLFILCCLVGTLEESYAMMTAVRPIYANEERTIVIIKRKGQSNLPIIEAKAPPLVPKEKSIPARVGPIKYDKDGQPYYGKSLSEVALSGARKMPIEVSDNIFQLSQDSTQ